MTREEIEAAAEKNGEVNVQTIRQMDRTNPVNVAALVSSQKYDSFIKGAEWARQQMQSQAAGDEPVSKELRVVVNKVELAKLFKWCEMMCAAHRRSLETLNCDDAYYEIVGEIFPDEAPPSEKEGESEIIRAKGSSGGESS